MSSNSHLRDLQLIVYDCDGVLTDNKVIVDEYGHEYATFNRGDGYGIACIRELNIRQIVISAEPNPIVKKRCDKLNLDVIYDVKDKKSVLQEYCLHEGICLSKTMYVGNDINDYDAMNIVGIRGCPEDAEPEIVAICEWISSKKGGNGVIRELYRYLAQSRGL